MNELKKFNIEKYEDVKVDYEKQIIEYQVNLR